jgi:shikimate dehydrogenase
MFDGVGFVDGLRRQGDDVASRRVHLLGVGGAGSAIAVALAEAGVSSLALQDRSAEMVARVTRSIQAIDSSVQVKPESVLEGDYDIVINATPLGMKEGDSLPCDPTRFARATLFVDIVTKPEMTPWLLAAASSGHPVHTGRHMHEGQAARAAAFFGLPVD